MHIRALQRNRRVFHRHICNLLIPRYSWTYIFSRYLLPLDDMDGISDSPSLQCILSSTSYIQPIFFHHTFPLSQRKGISFFFLKFSFSIAFYATRKKNNLPPFSLFFFFFFSGTSLHSLLFCRGWHPFSAIPDAGRNERLAANWY